jgi:hypothetical protein
MERNRAEYLVYQADFMLDLSWQGAAYLGGVVSPPETCAAYLLHYRPGSLERLAPVWQGWSIRVFRLDGEAEDLPQNPLFRERYRGFMDYDALAATADPVGAGLSLASAGMASGDPERVSAGLLLMSRDPFAVPAGAAVGPLQFLVHAHLEGAYGIMELEEDFLGYLAPWGPHPEIRLDLVRPWKGPASGTRRFASTVWRFPRGCSVTFRFTQDVRRRQRFRGGDNTAEDLSSLLTRDFISRICRRGTGIGADGLLELLPPAREGAFSMVYYNSDGGRAAMCGNGARCICRFAATAGVVKEGSEFLFTSDSGTHRGLVTSRNTARVWMTEPSVAFLTREIDFGRKWPVSLVDTGVPHAVVFREDIHDGSFEQWAEALRSTPRDLGPRGANADG